MLFILYKEYKTFVDIGKVLLVWPFILLFLRGIDWLARQRKCCACIPGKSRFSGVN